MDLNDFNYELPKELIAQKPEFPRSSSKILIAEKNKISYFNKLHEHLDSNDVLVINNTKVIPAIIFGKTNNRKIKITLHTKISINSWIAFAKPAKLLKIGNIINFSDDLFAKVIDKNKAHVELFFNKKEKVFYKFLNSFGELPIPPYIKEINNKKLNEAIVKFSDVIELDPNWAEAWNKRATVFYLIGEYQKSQNDIDKVLGLEKRHFGALAGQGLVNIELQNYEKAIKSYQEAMKIYPTMNTGKIMIKRIKELIKKQSI